MWTRAAVVAAVPLLVSAGVVTILVTSFRTIFLVNDDSTLEALINGDYTGHRTSSLVVAPTMLANAMRLGYVLFPRLPWYGIGLYALQIVAWAAIGTVAFSLRRRPPIAERIVIAVTILVLAPWMILRLSFTPTALLLGAAGVLVFGASAGVRGRVGVAYAVIAGVLLGAAYLVRSDSFWGAVVAFAPLLVLTAWKAGVRRSLTFALVVATFALVGFGSNRLDYSRTADWRAFMHMNSARSTLHGTNRLDAKNVSLSELHQIGWTRNDLKLFAGFFYPDPKVFTYDDIRSLGAKAGHLRPHDSWNRVANSLRSPVLLPLLVAVFLALRRRRRFLVSLAAAVWFFGVLIALSIFVRLPDRVLYPLEGGAALMAAVLPAYLSGVRAGERSGFTRKSIALVAVVALVLAVTAVDGVRGVPHIGDENSHAAADRSAGLADLTAFDPKGVYIATGNLFGMDADPLVAATPFANPRLIPLGWATNSPLFTARLTNAGVGDLFTALLRKPHVYLVGLQILAAQVQTFYLQHRGVKVRVKRESTTLYPFGETIWKFFPSP